jgi:hypothetical protein
MIVRNASVEYVTDTQDDGGGYPMLWVVPDDHRVLVSVPEAARKMHKSEDEVERLVALGFLHAEREYGKLKVEPAIVN